MEPCYGVLQADVQLHRVAAPAHGEPGRDHGQRRYASEDLVEISALMLPGPIEHQFDQFDTDKEIASTTHAAAPMTRSLADVLMGRWCQSRRLGP